MPANEASRINQYNLMLLKTFERLWVFKVYRTPRALRAIMRVTILILPIFYGPYWLYIMIGDGGGEVTTERRIFACCFACLITLLMIAMLNLADQTENPFRFGSPDTIRVKEEMGLCRKSIETAQGDLGTAWHEHLRFEWEDDASNTDSDESSP
mmetsp:Transcript_66115/g.204964  ORF Transcript_66115/g.204964 Transcript_66115/m.204964 type:complete len:154 (+) Transcript_66115:123-584(+)